MNSLPQFSRHLRLFFRLEASSMPDVFRASDAEIAKHKCKETDKEKKTQKAPVPQNCEKTRAAIQRVKSMYLMCICIQVSTIAKNSYTTHSKKSRRASPGLTMHWPHVRPKESRFVWTTLMNHCEIIWIVLAFHFLDNSTPALAECPMAIENSRTVCNHSRGKLPVCMGGHAN